VLEARGIRAGQGLLSSEAVGEIEKDDNVLVVKRIHVTYHLKLAPDQREAAQRVLEFHADFCPVARTIRDSVEITTSVEMEDEK
jgi:uncharacterized OsmC-like protein